MTKCANGWDAIPPGSNALRRGVLPGYPTPITAKDGSVFFLLAHYALWYSEKIERLTGGQTDDWWYAYRVIAGSNTISNHAGYAQDLNATKHGRGTRTFTRQQEVAIRWRLARTYRGCLASGIDWKYRDDMHTEIIKSLGDCEKVARRLVNTPRGKRILDANPGLRGVIFS